jgi:hypothetical protein
MVSKADSVRSVIDALERGGFVESSESYALPEPIGVGHPVHSAVVQLECCYTDQALPPRGRLRWKRVLRYSRRRDEGIYEVVDAFLDWLDKELSRDAPADQEFDNEVDGLKEFGFRLVWRGSSYDLQPQVWRTLKYFWSKGHSSLGDFEESVWGEVAVESATVRKAIQRANDALERAAVPWRLDLQNGQIKKMNRD